MLPLLLLLAGNPCLGPDVLHPVGNFEQWDGNDAEGWDRLSFGNGVLYSYDTSRGKTAAFQTVYGTAELGSQPLTLPSVNWALVAQVKGQLPQTVAISVKDLDSGRYLTAFGTWQDTPTDALIQQDVQNTMQQIYLPFYTEGAGRTVRVTVHSRPFGICGANGFCDCSPGLCPTGWVDEVRLCVR